MESYVRSTGDLTSWVGRRIVCDKTKNLKEIRWQAGIVRCTSSRNLMAKDFLICVEWDGKSWEQREWMQVHDVAVVFIEHHLTMLPHPINKLPSPALVFHPCKENLVPPHHVLVEFFDDRRKVFMKNEEIRAVAPMDECLSRFEDQKLREWVVLKKTQNLLMKGEMSLAGCRVLVYGVSSSLPWINAVVTKQLADRQLHIMNEQVLTQTTVDPITTQILFLDADVIDDVTGAQGRRSRRLARTQETSSSEKRGPVGKQGAAIDDFVARSNPQLSAAVQILRRNAEHHRNDVIRTSRDDVISKPMTSSIMTSLSQSRSSPQASLYATPSSMVATSRVMTSPPVASRTSLSRSSDLSEEMQQSQQQALSNLVAQQALLSETQKRQNQSPQQRGTPQQTRVPSQVFASPYLNPYAGLQLLYNNQAAFLAQAQLQAAALAASGARSPAMVMPWLKQAQQGALEKDLQQQQALYAAALYRSKALDGIPDLSAVFRPESLLGGGSSPSPRVASPRREKSNPDLYTPDRAQVPSPKELLAKKISHSSSPSPLRGGDPPVGLHGARQQPSPRTDLPKRAQSNVAMDQAELRRIEEERAREANREKEDSWRAKYFKTDGVVMESVRNSQDLLDKKWDPHLSHNITQTPLGMIDPATLFAAHGAQQFIRDDTVRQNGVVDKATTADSQVPRPPFVTSSSVAHSYKTWQPPVQMSEVERGKPASPKALPLTVPKTSPTSAWSRPPTVPTVSNGPQGKPPTSSVFNIHSLKYHPSTPSSKRASSPKSEKVIVKTSTVSGGKESVKYISDKSPLIHRPCHHSPSPEKLGPIMEDGSRARILPPESLKSLYRFPEPSSKARSTKAGTDSVIIKTGQYKVTEVHGGREGAPSVQPTSAGHIVYPKLNPQARSDPSYVEVSDSAPHVEKARKRGVEEEGKGESKKARSDPPQRDALRNLRDVSAFSDPHLRGLVGAGMFPISGSNIVWGDSSKIGSEYPGAPTKVALKGALLGLKNENGLNLSVNKPPAKDLPPNIPVSPPTAPLIPDVLSLPQKPTPEVVKNVEEKSPSNAVQETPAESPQPTPEIKKEPPLVLTHASSEAVTSAPIQVAQVTSAPSKSPLKQSPDDVTSKAGLCPKLKKAWIKRSYESDDKLKASTPPSADPTTESSPIHERAESDSAAEPAKKVKKKHKVKKEEKSKDAAPKKKRKHKEGKSGRKVDSPGELGDAKGRSNSRLFLQGKLLEECEGGSEEEGGEARKKDAVKMPLGENGLPISVLLCRKEQTRLKKSEEAFVQDAACHEIAVMNGVSIQTGGPGGSSLPKCRECRSAKRKENNAIFCRFYGFRKLSFVNGNLQACGFSEPEDSLSSDLSLWLPRSDGEDRMALETCRYVMKHVGGKFCELVQDEREALVEAEKTGKVRWKRPVHGVREMCDACETTLFNLHWVCRKCGFGICLDCYRARDGMSREDMEAYDGDKNNSYRWLRCGKGKYHLPSDLVPTQIIPSSCLFDLCELAHEVRAKWNVTSQCRCKKSVTSSLLPARANDPTPLLKNHCNSELLSQGGGKLPAAVKSAEMKLPNREGHRMKGFDCDNSASPLDWLASIALREQRKSSTTTAPSINKNNNVEEKGGKPPEKLPVKNSGVRPGPNSAAPRSWLCNGQLLQLTDSSSSVNVDTFQLHWFYGMPVMASGASDNLNRELWRPERFSAEHGHQPTGGALINCKKGSVITNALIRDFWNGFEKIDNRLRDERTGEKLILKLKDWPTTDDFIDTMPDKFDDLMRALPLPQYTARDGKFNIAAHLPDYFVRPDLGPKMYIAYGWVTEKDWSQGTTNLHLDISDACNLMVYVGIPEDEPPEAQETLISIIREGDADDAQVERARTAKAGALWHIFKAADTDKIRKLILKVKAEKGIEVTEDHDPIHDQQIYLDKPLRRRLKEEYGVEGYPLVQCEGDSVFIPAGAPHQVFNLHSCIKVAEDFVSPEHVDKCFKLTEEFRHLSTTHSNHEDKLQLKNIIYHTMKEVVSSFHKHQLRPDPEVDGSKPPQT